VFTVTSYPNPFNPQTKIVFTLPERGHVTVKIYNLRGELVRVLVDEVRESGLTHTVIWDGTNRRGAEVASGVYFYEVKSGGLTRVEKMALIK
jgi:flagellar hook assembly protein FlgD